MDNYTNTLNPLGSFACGVPHIGLGSSPLNAYPPLSDGYTLLLVDSSPHINIRGSGDMGSWIIAMTSMNKVLSTS